MPAEPIYPSQQPGDLLTYAVVSDLIIGGDPDSFAATGLELYGRWGSIMRQLFDAYAHGGRTAIFPCYLRAVYSTPEFALLMASQGMQMPDGEWRNDELPSRTSPTWDSSAAPPAPPAKKPARRQRSSYTLYELMTGHFDPPPLRRNAVREEEIRLALRTLGEATGADLARHTGQNRSNVHRRLNKLLEKGLVERYETPVGIVYRASFTDAADEPEF